MSSIKATLLRPGMVITHEGDLYSVFSTEHRTPGNKRGSMQTRMKNLRTGAIIDYRFRAEEFVKIEFHNEKAIGVDLPDTMDLKVVQTEPTLQKATASAVMKPATLETGLVVNVPPFVNQGDRIRVDTSEARYVQRVE